MQLVVLGATGTTGQLLLAAALEQGHRVTAVVRSLGVLPAHPQLRVLQADVFNAQQLQAAFTGADALISCLGQRPNLRAFVWGSHFQRRSLPAILAAIDAAQVPRFVLQSSFGVGETAAQAGAFLRCVLYGGIAKKMFDDKAEAEQALLNCRANWTAVYPVTLVQKPALAAADLLPLASVRQVPGIPRLPFANVAMTLLQLAADDAYARQKLLLTPVGSWC